MEEDIVSSNPRERKLGYLTRKKNLIRKVPVFIAALLLAFLLIKLLARILLD